MAEWVCEACGHITSIDPGDGKCPECDSKMKKLDDFDKDPEKDEKYDDEDLDASIDEEYADDDKDDADEEE